MKTIYLAGGCFWGCEEFFRQFDGVLHTVVGYANGNTENPTYEDVKHRGTGHAETVKIDFDEEVISLAELLDDYFLVIDPLSVNRQGEDEGIQYRTGIYYEDESLLPEIRARVEREAERLGQPLAVEVKPLENFYEAEEYHQKYLEKHPGGYCHIPRSMMHIAKGAK
ncbi:MAG: peptide-methionine (S)-S-oxide reductase MsrA [Clostridiales bacterium]|nr:peptide-methionine (S)-S-oxide reductase MsrA [Clostridiales bacterium]